MDKPIKTIIRWRWYLLAVLVVVLDQWTKTLIQANFDFAQRLSILPFFDLTLVYNKGAAWSFLSDAGGWQRWFLTAISSIASIVLVIWIHRLEKHQWLLTIALSLILGGAVGNLVDRVMLGQVVDFLLFFYDGHYFPAFNLADSAITCGAVLMILDIIQEARRGR